MNHIPEDNKEEITTWAAKVPIELKNKLTSFIKEENISSKDFMSNLMDLYELDRLKKDSGIEKDLEDLQRNLNRILEVFKNSLIRNNSLENDLKEKYILIINEKDKEVAELCGKVKAMKDNIQEYQEMLEQLEKENLNIKNEYTKVERELMKTESLVEEYKYSKENLVKLLEEQERLKKDISEFSIENLKNKETMDKLKTENLDLKYQIHSLQQKHEKDLLNIDIKNTQFVSNLKDEHQKEVRMLLDKYNSDIRLYISENSKLKEELLKKENSIHIFKMQLKDNDSQIQNA